MKQRNRKHALMARMRAAKWKHLKITVSYTETYSTEYTNAMKDWIKHLRDLTSDTPPLYPAAVISALQSKKPNAIRFAHQSYVKLGGKRINEKTSVIAELPRIKHHAHKHFARREKRWRDARMIAQLNKNGSLDKMIKDRVLPGETFFPTAMITP